MRIQEAQPLFSQVPSRSTTHIEPTVEPKRDAGQQEKARAFPLSRRLVENPAAHFESFAVMASNMKPCTDVAGPLGQVPADQAVMIPHVACADERFRD